MAQEISLYGSNDKLAMPAHLAARFSQAQSNIITDSRIATLGIRAKKFTLTVGGESQVLQKRDEESGDMVPVGVLPVVVLDYAVRMGRSYYDSAFDPDVQAQPTCWSLDGVIPEPEVAEKQASRCSACPKAVKGSKMGDNDTPLVACAPHRILAVVPVRKLDLPPLQLRIAQTSDYDGKNAEAKAQNYFAFKQYLEALKSRGVPSTRAVVTNLSFDNSGRISYPKLFFRAQRWLEPAELEGVDKIMESGKVRELLTWTGTEASLAGEGTRPDVDPAVVERVVSRSAGAQDGRFAGAEDALGERVDTRASQKEKATAAASAKSQGAAPNTDTPEVTAARRAAEARAAVKAEPAKAATFTFREMEAGEDEDDYNIEKAKARKAWNLAGAAAPAKPAEFVPPAREEGEDEDDFNIRVAQARKAFKKANGGTAPAPQTAKTVTAEPVPAGQEKPASAFPGGTMDLGGDDDGPAAPAGAPPTASAEPPKRTRGANKPKGEAAGAKAPNEAVVAQAVPDDVSKILTEWE